MGGPVVPLVSMRTAVPGRSGFAVTLGPAVPAAAITGRPRAEARRRRRGRPQAVGHQLGHVVGFAGQHAEVQRGDVVAGALPPVARVDGHHAAAGGEHAQQEADGGRSVAQDDADLGPGALDQRGRLARRVGQLAPGRPRTFELDRRRAGVDGQHLGDALCEAGAGDAGRPVVDHRRRGSRRGCGLCGHLGHADRVAHAGCRSAPAPSRRGTADRATPRSPAPCPPWPSGERRRCRRPARAPAPTARRARPPR